MCFIILLSADNFCTCKILFKNFLSAQFVIVQFVCVQFHITSNSPKLIEQKKKNIIKVYFQNFSLTDIMILEWTGSLGIVYETGPA